MDALFSYHGSKLCRPAPKSGQLCVNRRLIDEVEEALEYLQRIHGAIREIAATSKMDDPMKLCAEMVKILKLPEIAVNPLIAKSFLSHLNSDGSVKSLTFINGAD
jgi:hypothetical protein